MGTAGSSEARPGRSLASAAHAAACVAESAAAAAAAHPEDAFKKMFAETARARAVKAAGEATFSLEILQDLQGLMDVGIRVNHDLVRLWAGS